MGMVRGRDLRPDEKDLTCNSPTFISISAIARRVSSPTRMPVSNSTRMMAMSRLAVGRFMVNLRRRLVSAVLVRSAALSKAFISSSVKGMISG